MLRPGQYRYGASLLRLVSISAAAWTGAILIFALALVGNQRLRLGMIQLPHWLDMMILLGVALVLLAVATCHNYLTIRRFTAPQFVTINETALVVPAAPWNNRERTIAFDDVQKVIGPRAGKLEIRNTGDSYFLETEKFETESDFRECCQRIFGRMGIARDLAANVGKPPLYRQIAQKFATGHVSEYYGAVIASADAFFLVRLKNFHYRGKHVTEGISDAIEKLSGKERLEIELSALPETILDHEDWPLWDCEGTVRIVPKAAIRSIRFPWWGAITVKTADWRFSIAVPFWKQGTARRYLRETGWSV